MRIPSLQFVVPALAGLIIGLGILQTTFGQAPAEHNEVDEHIERSSGARIISIQFGEGAIEPSPDMMRIMLNNREAITKRLPEDIPGDIDFNVVVIEDVKASGRGGKVYFVSVVAITNFSNIKSIADAVLAELSARLATQLLTEPKNRLMGKLRNLQEELHQAEERLSEGKLHLALINDDPATAVALSAKRTQLQIENATASARASLFEKRLEDISKERNQQSANAREMRNVIAVLEEKVNEGGENISKVSSEIKRLEDALSQVEAERDWWSKEIQQIKNDISKHTVDRALKDHESEVIQKLLSEHETQRMKSTEQRLELQLTVARIEREHASLMEELAKVKKELRELEDYEFQVWD